MKFLKHGLLVLLLFLNACSYFSPKQRAIRKVDRKQRSINMVYAKYPELKPKQDTVYGEVVIDNPIVKIDTVYSYTDTGSIRTLNKLLFERINDTVYVNKVIKLFRDKKCIGDSLILDEDFYKLKVTEDSLGLHFLVTPKDTILSERYKQACPPVIIPVVHFYDFSEFWLLVSVVAGLGIIILLIKR